MGKTRNVLLNPSEASSPLHHIHTEESRSPSKELSLKQVLLSYHSSLEFIFHTHTHTQKKKKKRYKVLF